MGRSFVCLYRALPAFSLALLGGCYGSFEIEGHPGIGDRPVGRPDAFAADGRDGSLAPGFDASVGTGFDGGTATRDAGIRPADADVVTPADGSISLGPIPPMETAYEACQAFERLLCLGELLCCDRESILGIVDPASACTDESLSEPYSFVHCEFYLGPRATDGTITYDESAARSLYTTVRSELRSCERTRVWTSLEKGIFVEGTLAEGAECFGEVSWLNDLACGPGLHCASYVTEGFCEPIRSEGGVCGNSEACDVGFYCEAADDRQRCTPRKALDDACPHDTACLSGNCEAGRCAPLTDARSWCVPTGGGTRE